MLHALIIQQLERYILCVNNSGNGTYSALELQLMFLYAFQENTEAIFGMQSPNVSGFAFSYFVTLFEL